jgi:N6-L-threonylcarbamoyladenine synthase
MLVLGIESSCDETGAAIVRDGRYLLSNVVASQIEIHNRYGGVVPEVASRQQLAAILPVIETALEQAKCSWDKIDAVAATYGPGLAGSLLVGLTVGKTLALARDLPFLGVNHLEAHMYANWLRSEEDVSEQEVSSGIYRQGDPQFPLICLVVSGAHSEIVLVRDHGQYELLGHTRDDAAGEAFDKVARILGLGYPGGPAIEKAAQEVEEKLLQQHKSLALARSAYRLPRAWLRGTYDFSFSGLKTAMLHLAEGAAASVSGGSGVSSAGSVDGRTTGGVADASAQKSARGTASSQRKQVSQYTRMGAQAAQQGIANVAQLASSFQEAIVDVLAVKTRLAAQEYHVGECQSARAVGEGTIAIACAA